MTADELAQKKDDKHCQKDVQQVGGKRRRPEGSPMLMAVKIRQVWQLIHVAAASAAAEQGMDGRSKAEVS